MLLPPGRQRLKASVAPSQSARGIRVTGLMGWGAAARQSRAALNEVAPPVGAAGAGVVWCVLSGLRPGNDQRLMEAGIGDKTLIKGKPRQGTKPAGALFKQGLLSGMEARGSSERLLRVGAGAKPCL